MNKYLAMAFAVIVTLSGYFWFNKKTEKEPVIEGKIDMKSLENSEKISKYYSQGGEAERLFVAPDGIIERLRTQAIISRYAPKPPAVVYDIGGGAGVYAFPLAEQGYKVHLIDLTPLHIEQAKKRMKETGINLVEYSVGDARTIAAPDACADIVLLLGPLYHLQDKPDRLKAIREAYRILKPGGLICAAAISRFASFLYLGSNNLLHDTYLGPIIEEDIKTGRHNNPKSDPRFFTTAYYHLPEDLEQEVKEGGFKNVKVMGVEGPSILFASLKETVEDKQALASLLHFLELIETDKNIMASTSHLMAVAYK
jgi:ubiquinone/menaquinone biosynthesis C-methylase UbiE